MPAPVLFQETGTGRKLPAQSIHNFQPPERPTVSGGNVYGHS